MVDLEFFNYELGINGLLESDLLFVCDGNYWWDDI